MSTRDFGRPQRPRPPDGGQPGRRERDDRDRFLRQSRDQSGGSDDPLGLYRPAGGRNGGARNGGSAPGGAGTWAGTATFRQGAPGRPGFPAGPGFPPRPGAPVRPGMPGTLPPGGLPPGRRRRPADIGDGLIYRYFHGPWTWKKIVATLVALFATGLAGLAILIGVAYAQTPIPSAVSQLALQQNSIVYFSDGKTVVGTFGATDRQILTYNQIPAVLRNAVLAAEDRQFYTEGGISLTGTLRAAYNDFTGGSVQGGSTITQQFVRNYYQNIGSQQTLSRKLKEIFVAMKLARQKSKEWILTQYLNTIYLGNGAYGVGAASQLYFGVPAAKLTVSQAAVLAAIIQSPSYYPTPAGRQALMARWGYVLYGMVTMGTLSQPQAAAAKFPALDENPQLGNWDGYNGYIMQAVWNELRDTYHYPEDVINNGGLRVVTTFSPSKMAALYRAVRENEALMREGGRALPSYAHIGAVLEDPYTGAILAMYSGPGLHAKNCAKIYCNVDMALQNREQVGSSFKPYVLAAARMQGMNVKTSILDGSSPLCVPPDTAPMVYSVPGSKCPASVAEGHVFSNDPGDTGLGGPQSVEYATAQSLNTAYTDLTHRVGTAKVIDMAQQLGVNTGPYSQDGSGLGGMTGQVGIALGQSALTVGEQASTFATFANNGVYITPHVIAQITQGNTPVRLRVIHRQAIPPDVAADVDWALSYDTINGTATRAAMADGRPIIGKTGTTETAQSAFFIGAIPQYSLAVGIFTNHQNGNLNDPESLNGLGGLSGGGYGGFWPSMIWHTFAEAEFAQLPIMHFLPPVFGGVLWNLYGALPKPHKHHEDNQDSPPGQVCGPLNPFCGHHHKSPSPCPPGVLLPGCPPPTANPSPSPTIPSLPPTPGPGATGPPGGLTGAPAVVRSGSG